MAASDSPMVQRLFEGAKIVGDLWRKGERCLTAGWAVKGFEGAESCEDQFDADELCKCGVKATRFCKAKVQWMVLAMAEPRDIVTGEFGFALTMKRSEWDASGLTLTWNVPEIGALKIGVKGALTMKELQGLMDEPLAARATLQLIRAFPGAKVEFEKGDEAPVKA
jgi:hypothetical protein